MSGEFWNTWSGGTGASQGGRFIKTNVLSTGSALVLSGATNNIRVRGQAGGAGGGGVATAAVSGGGAGGGSAGGSFEKYFAVTPGGTCSYTIGTAGIAATTGAVTGGVGGNTTFAYGGTTVTAVGGNGGIGITAAVAIDALGGAPSAISTNGDINACGAPGSPGASVSATVCLSGSGGSSPWGAGGNGRITTGDGNPATGFGSGGAGGACVNAGVSVAGGAGAAGLIIVDELT